MPSPKRKRPTRRSETEIEDTIREVTAILDSWAKEGSRVVLSAPAGLSGIRVEGTLLKFREDDPIYLFRSVGEDVTKLISSDLMPSIERLKADKVILRFGPSASEHFSLRLSPVQKKPPANLAEVVRQLEIWASQKAEVLTALDFGFVTFSYRGSIEQINDEIWGLTEDGPKRVHVIIPKLCTFAKLERVGDDTLLTLLSDGGRIRVQMVDCDGAAPDRMQFMSKLIH